VLVSVIFAVYKSPGYVEKNYLRLKKSNVECEFILAADEPDSKTLFIARKYSFLRCFSSSRRGKWRALNEAAKLAKGKYLLFIDSDTILECSLEDIIKALQKYDVVEIRKEIMGKKIIEKLVNIDYLNMFTVAKLCEKFNSCLGVNGAAFAIKRDVFFSLNGFRNVVNEDTDLGLRISLKGYSFGTVGKAKTESPKSFKDWLVQRERWATGGAEAILDAFPELIKKPLLWIPAIYLVFPAIVLFILNNLITGNILVKIIYLLLPIIIILPQKLLLIILFILFQERLLKNIVVGITTFIVWMLIEIFVSVKLKWKISYLLLPIFYFFYSPIWMLISFVALLRVLVLKLSGKKVKVKNWNP